MNINKVSRDIEGEMQWVVGDIPKTLYLCVCLYGCVWSRFSSAVMVLTPQCSLEVDLGLAVEVLYAGRSATWQEHVLLLVPRGCVLDRPLALLIQVRHRYGGRREREGSSMTYS